MADRTNTVGNHAAVPDRGREDNEVAHQSALIQRGIAIVTARDPDREDGDRVTDMIAYHDLVQK